MISNMFSANLECFLTKNIEYVFKILLLTPPPGGAKIIWLFLGFFVGILLDDLRLFMFLCTISWSYVRFVCFLVVVWVPMWSCVAISMTTLDWYNVWLQWNFIVHFTNLREFIFCGNSFCGLFCSITKEYCCKTIKIQIYMLVINLSLFSKQLWMLKMMKC